MINPKHIAALYLVGLLVALSPFTNCSSYEESQNVEQQSVLACDDDCVEAKRENISIRPNLGAVAELRVKPGLADFDIGGDCNEGGYPVNLIRWTLYYGSTALRNSSMGGWDSRCVSGRMRLYVNLNAVTGDNFNRTGLYINSTTRATHDLVISIYSFKTTEEYQQAIAQPALLTNTPMATSRVNLIPITP